MVLLKEIRASLELVAFSEIFGHVIFAFLEPLGITTNTQVELRAIYIGLKLYKERGFLNIWIETDALAIIKLISAPHRGAWNHHNLLQKIRTLMRYTETKISHIYREGNQLADYLANQACTSQQFCTSSKEQLTCKAKGQCCTFLYAAATAPLAECVL
ncbi:UNVERIFIED_CONTAM: hypothetical protein Scaly_3017300 [Sesamum calycinum]|uniref:RNase H type-1 domain-containing protein n=1 Tax=Sesamum calycinum TaxID=2727403 RepID=A0AAW2KDQ2_9LAMI